MDAILSLALAETAQALQVDRGLILRLKYYNPLYRNQYDQSIPPARVEVVLDWSKTHQKAQNSNLSSYELSDSPLTVYAWKNSPQLVAMASYQELQKVKLELAQDVEEVFPLPNLEALLIVPLFGNYSNYEDKPIVLGFLIFQHHEPHQWKNGEIDMAKWVALQASSSIINQQTLQKVQSLVDERTSQLKVSLEVQAKLSEKMRHHLEELRRLNKIKDQFIASLSDALRTPLANMKMGIKMLKMVTDSHKSQRYLNILEAECEKEINLVNNLLTLQELEAKKLALEPQKLYLKPIFDEFNQIFTQEWEDKELTLELNYELDFLYTDLKSFKLILKELLHNAAKFSLPNTTVTLKLYPQGEQTILQVTNIGHQIPESEQEQIFQPFYQSQETTSGSNTGTGLGLALVKSLVENFHGAVAVASIPCQNKDDYFNTFTITLPQLPS
jgi:signal transduction histidine kinase